MAIKGDVFLALQFKSQPTRRGGGKVRGFADRIGISRKKITRIAKKTLKNRLSLGSVPPPLFRSNGEDLLPKFSQGRGGRGW